MLSPAWTSTAQRVCRGAGHNFAPRTTRAGTSSFTLRLLNCTSLMACWGVVSAHLLEANVLIETKLTVEEQTLMRAQLDRRGYNVTWSEPVVLKGDRSAAGRSGGVAIIMKNEWLLTNDRSLLELECAPTCWAAA